MSKKKLEKILAILVCAVFSIYAAKKIYNYFEKSHQEKLIKKSPKV